MRDVDRLRLRVRAARVAGELVYLWGFRGTAVEARAEIQRRWPALSSGEVSDVVRALTSGETNGLKLPKGRPKTYGAAL